MKQYLIQKNRYPIDIIPYYVQLIYKPCIRKFMKNSNFRL